MSAGYDGSIRIDTRVNVKGFNDGIKNMQSGMNRIKSSLGGLAKAIGAAFAIRSLINFGKQAVTIASDLTEVQNVVETAFGSMTDQVDEWSKSSIKNFGMSELAAKRTASTYMAMNAGMGLVGQGAADMAMRVAERTADVASFYNMTQEEADTMLKSIWTGETETLKRIGVVMTQTNLDAYALANGYGKTVKKMTQAEQVQLRYAFVMNQTRLAAGDFVRTQDSWANQTRILSEQWKQFLGIMGGMLIQVLTPAIKFLNQFVGALIQWAQTISNAVSGLFGKSQQNAAAAGSAAAQLGASSEDAAAGQSDLAKETKKANKELKNQQGSIDELNILSVDSGSSEESGGVAAIPSVGGLAATAIDETGTSESLERLKSMFRAAADYISRNFGPPISETISKIAPQIDRFKNTLKTIWSDIGTLGAPLKQWFVQDFTPFLQTYIRVWGDIVSGLFDSFNMVFYDIWKIAVFPVMQKFVTVILPLLTQVGTRILTTLGNVFNVVKTVFDALWRDVISPTIGLVIQIWGDMWDILAGLWDSYGQPIFDNIDKAINNIKTIFLSLWNSFLKPIFDKIFNVLNELWTNHLKPLIAQIGEVVAKMVNGATEIYNKFIAPVVNWFVNVLGPPISRVINTIIEGIGRAIGTIVDVAKSIFKILGGIIDFVTGVFTLNWEKAWNGIKDIFKGIWDTLVGIVKAPINGIIWLLNQAIGFINGILGQLNKFKIDLPGFLGGGTIGFNIPSIPNIPYLANGAVIPPNNQFLAVLGDQVRGRNLEAPESLLRSIVREETASKNDGYGEQTLLELKDIHRTMQNMELQPIIALDDNAIGKSNDRYQAKKGTIMINR